MRPPVGLYTVCPLALFVSASPLGAGVVTPFSPLTRLFGRPSTSATTGPSNTPVNNPNKMIFGLWGETNFGSMAGSTITARTTGGPTSAGVVSRSRTMLTKSTDNAFAKDTALVADESVTERVITTDSVLADASTFSARSRGAMCRFSLLTVRVASDSLMMRSLYDTTRAWASWAAAYASCPSVALCVAMKMRIDAVYVGGVSNAQATAMVITATITTTTVTQRMRRTDTASRRVTTSPF